MKKTSELREMSVDQLKREHLDLLREKFNLRMQGGQMGPNHHLRNVRKSIARVLTILSDKIGTKS